MWPARIDKVSIAEPGSSPPSNRQADLTRRVSPDDKTLSPRVNKWSVSRVKLEPVLAKHSRPEGVMMYQVVMCHFEFLVMNGQGVRCAGPFIMRHDAQMAADQLNRSKAA
jgi:hypothetical protein